MGKLQHVLLIEDDPITNFINKRLIQKFDNLIEVSIASNGLIGIDFLKSLIEGGGQLPQLILLDINMPVMDGFEFLEQFQGLNITEKIVIVMLTTSNHIQDLDKLFRTGNSDIIAKPLTGPKWTSLTEKYFVTPDEYSKTA